MGEEGRKERERAREEGNLGDGCHREGVNDEEARGCGEKARRVCIYIYICIYIHTYVFIHIYTHKYTFIYIYTYT